MNKNHKSITFQQAAAELCVSDSTILRLVQRGTLHTTKRKLVGGHWTRRIVLDKAYYEEKHRRMHGLKAPRRKHIPSAIDPHDPSPIQTITPPAEPQNACPHANGVTEIPAYHYGAAFEEVIDYSRECVKTCARKAAQCVNANRRLEEFYTRCTAILATACVLQLILAIYYTLCHFNII